MIFLVIFFLMILFFYFFECIGRNAAQADGAGRPRRSKAIARAMLSCSLRYGEKSSIPPFNSTPLPPHGSELCSRLQRCSHFVAIDQRGIIDGNAGEDGESAYGKNCHDDDDGDKDDGDDEDGEDNDDENDEEGDDNGDGGGGHIDADDDNDDDDVMRMVM